MAEGTELRLWPRSADPEYVEARRALRAAERELVDAVERVAAARRSLPPGGLLGDHVFVEGPGDLARDEPEAEVGLLDLFGEHDTLLIYHLMFAPGAGQGCPMCSMWVDGFHGVAHHLAQHTAFAVVAKAPSAELRAWGRARGWEGLRLVSSYGTDFNIELGVEEADGHQQPGVSVLLREGRGVRHFYTGQAAFTTVERERGIDLLSPVWQALDLLPTGRGQWYAGNSYTGASRG
ncbi:DUF899 family protein [Saccharopolyspora sp. CA-218241]|uniref:DUF899 family protein n=1 Tax=Saccharopolyspora sp. CA-218241 TaxID=3240027 RepID=UPI003D96CF7A